MFAICVSLYNSSHDSVGFARKSDWWGWKQMM